MTESNISTPSENDNNSDSKKPAVESPKGSSVKNQPTAGKKRTTGNSLMRLLAVVAVLALAGAAGWTYLGDRVQPVLPGFDSGPTPGLDPSRSATGTDDTSVAPNRPANLPSLQRRLAALEARPQSLGSDTQQAERLISVLAGRMDRLEQLLARQSETQIPAGLVNRIAGLEQRLDRLEKTLASANPSNGFQASALAFVLGQLGDTINSGRPFGADLDRVSALAATMPNSGDPSAAPTRIMVTIAELRGHSARGVSTVAQLQREFGDMARAVLAASSGAPGGDWTDAVRARLSSVVTVRRTGDLAGNTPEAHIARAEVQVNAGQLEAAINELSGLEGSGAEAAAPWLARAQSRVAAKRRFRAVEDAVAEAVMGPTTGNAGAG